jgi:hypothetical protein
MRPRGRRGLVGCGRLVGVPNKRMDADRPGASSLCLSPSQAGLHVGWGDIGGLQLEGELSATGLRLSRAQCLSRHGGSRSRGGRGGRIRIKGKTKASTFWTSNTTDAETMKSRNEGHTRRARRVQLGGKPNRGSEPGASRRLAKHHIRGRSDPPKHQTISRKK